MAYFWQIHKIWEKELFRLMSYEGKLEYVLILLVDNDSMNSLTVVCFSFFFLIGIHPMQGWTATTRHGVTRKKSTEKITGYRKSV